MGDFMRWLAWLLLELQAPCVPDWLLLDPHYQYALKEVLVRHEVESPDRLRYPHWGIDWQNALEQYRVGKTLPPLSALEQFGFNSRKAVGELGDRLEWAREARRNLAARVELLPRGLRRDYQPLLDEFDYRILVWSELLDAAQSNHCYGNPLGARHKMKAMQEKFGDVVRNRNLGPIIPDGYWRILR